MFNVWRKYNLREGVWCVGLESRRIDKLALQGLKAKVKYWKNKTEYEIEAKKVQKMPKEPIKGYDLYVYVVPISALSPAKVVDLNDLEAFSKAVL